MSISQYSRCLNKATQMCLHKFPFDPCAASQQLGKMDRPVLIGQLVFQGIFFVTDGAGERLPVPADGEPVDHPVGGAGGGKIAIGCFAQRLLGSGFVHTVQGIEVHFYIARDFPGLFFKLEIPAMPAWNHLLAVLGQENDGSAPFKTAR